MPNENDSPAMIQATLYSADREAVETRFMSTSARWPNYDDMVRSESLDPATTNRTTTNSVFNEAERIMAVQDEISSRGIIPPGTSMLRHHVQAARYTESSVLHAIVAAPPPAAPTTGDHVTRAVAALELRARETSQRDARNWFYDGVTRSMVRPSVRPPFGASYVNQEAMRSPANFWLDETVDASFVGRAIHSTMSAAAAPPAPVEPDADVENAAVLVRNWMRANGQTKLNGLVLESLVPVSSAQNVPRHETVLVSNGHTWKRVEYTTSGMWSPWTCQTCGVISRSPEVFRDACGLRRG